MIGAVKHWWETSRILMMVQLVDWRRLSVYTFVPGHNSRTISLPFLRKLVYHLQNQTDHTQLALVEGDRVEWLCIGQNPAALWQRHCAYARWHRAEVLLPAGQIPAVTELEQYMLEQGRYFAELHGIRLPAFNSLGRQLDPRRGNNERD